MKRSTLETGFLNLWRAIAKRPDPVEQYRFHPERKWRLDFAFPEQRIAVEIDGGIFVRGGHNRGMQFSKDCEKHNALTMLNWSLLRYTILDLRQRPMEVIEEVCELLDLKS